ncbi:hypothetical protein BC826DRAFT_990415, partial [Russula brevipes]
MTRPWCGYRTATVCLPHCSSKDTTCTLYVIDPGHDDVSPMFRTKNHAGLEG